MPHPIAGPFPSDSAIFAAVDAWLDALAEEDYAKAYDLTLHDPYYAWTPSLIRQAITGYGAVDEDRGMRVTSRAVLSSAPSDRDVDREHNPPGSVATVSHSLPLNGAWSDLTATFRVVATGGGFALLLEEIHVF